MRDVDAFETKDGKYFVYGNGLDSYDIAREKAERHELKLELMEIIDDESAVEVILNTYEVRKK